MPVPRSGFVARKSGAAGAAREKNEAQRTKMILSVNAVMHFGARRIFLRIAWLNLEQFPL